MPSRAPLSTPLSQVLIAFTIELDNEFERRFEEAGGGARVTSLVMWSNLLRFVGDGIAVGELPDAVGLQKPRVLSALGGVERWRYVYVTPTRRGSQPKERRDGYGSARGLKDDWSVRLTPAGRRAAAIWPELPGEIAARWRARFGAAEIEKLEGALRELAAAIDLALPEYLPIVGGSNGMALDLPIAERGPQPTADLALVALLGQALMAYTIEFEVRSALSLPLSANVVRVLDEDGELVRELPSRSGISKEAIAMAVTFLTKTDYIVVEGASAASKTIRLTLLGATVRADDRRLQSGLDKQWEAQSGVGVVERLRSSLEHVLEHPDLPSGLSPPANGWRGSRSYVARTKAVLSDPRGALPHHPMVLHRGGWPDGS